MTLKTFKKVVREYFEKSDAVAKSLGGVEVTNSTEYGLLHHPIWSASYRLRKV